MKKIILSIIILTGFSLSGNSQVVIGGNGTPSPQANANLEIIKSATGPNGILIPRLTVQYLDNNKALYGADQDGILVFVTDGSGTGATTDKIKASGFYAYDASSNKWLNIDPPTYGSGSFKPTAVSININTGDTWDGWETGDYKKYNYFEFQGTASTTASAKPFTNITLPDPAKWADRTIYIRNNTSGVLTYSKLWDSFVVSKSTVHNFSKLSSATHQFYSDGTRWYLMGGGGNGNI